MANKRTDNTNLYQPTGIFLDLTETYPSESAHQVYLDCKTTSVNVLTIEPRPGTLLNATSMDKLREEYAAQLGEYQAEREARRVKKEQQQAKSNQVPVSLVTLDIDLGTAEDDYLIIGQHATSKTPLLRTLEGKPARLTPDQLRRSYVLDRLDATAWIQWRNLKAARQAAITEFKALNERRPETMRARLIPGQQFRISHGYGSSRHVQSDDVTVDWSFDPTTETFSTDYHERQLTADNLDDLGEALLAACHPDNGQPALIVTTLADGSLSFERGIFQYQGRWAGTRTTFYLNTSQAEYETLSAAREQAETAVEMFLAEHKLAG
jgi:hypothetical protein